MDAGSHKDICLHFWPVGRQSGDFMWVFAGHVASMMTIDNR